MLFLIILVSVFLFGIYRAVKQDDQFSEDLWVFLNKQRFTNDKDN